MRYFILLFVAVATLSLVGCEKHMVSSDYSLPVVIHQTASEPERESVVENKSVETGLPELWDYIPADGRESIFDQLLGKGTDVYFEKNDRGETFAAFKPESKDLQALAQVRKVGNDDGFVLVFAGINCQSQPPVISGVYTFEYGEPMSGIDLYSQKKDGFLQKFSGNNAGEKVRVDAITGATMICDPLGKEINDISRDLLAIKDNADIFNMSKKMLSVDKADEPVTVAAKPVKPRPVAIKEASPPVVKPEKNVIKQPGIEKMLQNNANKVATIEIVLVSLATGIIIGTTATNRRNK